MPTFIAMIVIWLFVIFFVSAELYRRMKPVRALGYSFLLNGVCFGLSVVVWFAAESDGFAQVFGAMIYGCFFGVLTIALGVITWVVNRSRRK